jgi:hypothetical protein
MTDVNTVAEPSAAKERVQYDSWDAKGNPIVSKSQEKDTPKKEEPAASAATAKESQSEPDKGKSAAEPEAAKSQEKDKDKKDRKPGEKKSAEERIAELTAKVKELTEDRERSRSEKATEPARKTEDTKPEAKKDAQPANYADWRKDFKPKEWIEKWSKDNPTASYEDAVSALADYQSDVRDRYRQLEHLQQQGRARAQEQLRKTVEKYPDAEPKVKETARELTKMPQELGFVRAFIDDSDVMTDLLYTLSDQETLQNLIETAKTHPGKALRVLRDMELEIAKAVTSKSEDKTEKKSSEKEEEKTPAEPKPRAPKPPVEVGGRGTGQDDPSVAAARTGDYRAFEAAENAKMKARFTKA